MVFFQRGLYTIFFRCRNWSGLQWCFSKGIYRTRVFAGDVAIDGYLWILKILARQTIFPVPKIFTTVCSEGHLNVAQWMEHYNLIPEIAVLYKYPWQEIDGECIRWAASRGIEIKFYN